MKENVVDILRVYNLVSIDGNKLRLYLGRIKGSDDYFDDKGFRWCFVGNKIPMPVRSDTWFNGFPEHIMLDWLKGNGWALHTSVSMNTGVVTVCAMPFCHDHSKGNEKSYGDEIPYDYDQKAFYEVIRELVRDNRRATAVRIYRYTHKCSLCTANRAVKEICGEV